MLDISVFKNKEHFPVLIRELKEQLNPEENKVYVDCTFGRGSYSEMVLSHKNTKVIAFDRDENVLKFAKDFEAKYKDRFFFINDVFSNLERIKELGFTQVDGFMFDFGLSTMQIENQDRGFSFSKNGLLSMQMGKNHIDAKKVVNSYKENEIADILYKYGDERKSRIIAKYIVEKRKQKPIETTFELKDIVHSALRSPKIGKIDSATKSFQALRIYVNNELYHIENALSKTLPLLVKGGKIVAVSFHSLEDKIVKNFFNKHSKPPAMQSRHVVDFDTSNNFVKTLLPNKKVITPQSDETALNKASRSAKMRVAIKL